MAGQAGKKSEDGRVVIKKYANRRLYNTDTSVYVTLDHLSAMVKEGVDFVVYDAKTGEDLTRQVLTQIIFEAEGKGQGMLSVDFLRQLIRLYGDSLQALAPSYLQLSLETFMTEQERLREQFAAVPGMGAFGDQMRANMAMFDQAMAVFNPFGFQGVAPAQTEPEKTEVDGAPLDELRRQMAQMQSQLEKLASKG